MFKTLSPDNLRQQPKVKCGEIFSHSFTDYTIYCTFCNMKSFKFEDFVKHIQNFHYENNLLKTETINMEYNQCLEVNVKNEYIIEEEEEEKVIWDDLEQTCHEEDIDSNVLHDKENTVAILKETEERITLRKRKKPKSIRESDNEDLNHSSNEDFKTTLNVHKPPIGVGVKKSLTNPKLSKIIKNSRVQDEKPVVKSKKKHKEIIQHSCPECKEMFLHLKLLYHHVNEFHGGFKCSMCDERFRGRAHLEVHEKTHTAEKKFTCPIEECGPGFTEEEYLKRHLVVYTMECVKNEYIMEEEKLIWDDWEQTYDETEIANNVLHDEISNKEEPVAIIKKIEKNLTLRKRKKPKPIRESDNEDHDHSSDEDFNSMLNVHKPNIGVGVKKSLTNSELSKPKQKDTETIHALNVKKHSCSECKEFFLHLKLLDRHVNEFHGGYKCSMCDKRFRRRAHLVRHEKTHTAEKKFTCPIEECGRRFTEKEYLKRHLEVHTMERTFKCNFENCGKAFHTKRRLNTHSHTHRTPKSLFCDLCSFSCRSNYELMRHNYIHSDERTFKCKLCDSAFKHPSAFDCHMRRLHRPLKP